MPIAARTLAASLVLAATPLVLGAQHGATGHADHAGHVMPTPAGRAQPTLPGQDAYGAIAEVVRLLDADPSTDWSKVDLERLRQHLIDMNEVTLRSVVRQTPVEGGLRIDVTGAGRAADAIRRMTAAHGAQLAAAGIAATSEPIAGGARFTVRAADRGDAALVARVRALGFIGVMVLGDHHAPHHLAIARGAAMAGHDGPH